MLFNATNTGELIDIIEEARRGFKAGAQRRIKGNFTLSSIYKLLKGREIKIWKKLRFLQYLCALVELRGLFQIC